MAENKALTREQIEEKEALHVALTKLLNGTEISNLDKFHKEEFGGDFNPELPTEEMLKQDPVYASDISER